MPQRQDHRARRAAILSARPEVRHLLGPTAVTAWLGIGVVALQFGLAALLARQPVWMLAIAAFCVGGFAVHCLNCIMHEASHNLVFDNTALNKMLAIVANTPSLVPSAMAFRHYHLLHNNHFGLIGLSAYISAKFDFLLLKNIMLRIF
jgi:sphingolipid delta-4 desaturase